MRRFTEALALSEVGIAQMDKIVLMPIVVTVMAPVRFSASDGKVTGVLNPSFEEIAAAAAKRGGIVRTVDPSISDVEREAKYEKII
jgi:hypothetical protein